MLSSILPLPLSNPLGSLPSWFIGGLWSLPPMFRGGLGTNFGFAAGPRSLVLQIAYCKLVGLKSLTQTFKVSIKPSVKRIISLDCDTSCTMSASLWNSSIYTSRALVCVSCVSSLKCSSGSPSSNLSMSL
jgi:hypothetical protein